MYLDFIHKCFHKSKSHAGTLESGDVLIRIQPVDSHDVEIELESVPAELPFCYEEQAYEIQRTTPSTLNVNPSKESSEGKVQLTEEERQRVLDEVERQQTEFGTEK